MTKNKLKVRRTVPLTVDHVDQLPSSLKDPKARKLYDELREYARGKGFNLVLSVNK